MNTPRFKEPPLTRKPTAVVLVSDGRFTRPDSALNVAPVPMNNSAPVTATESNSPFKVSEATVTPDTWDRPTFTVALPSTTSAMLNPTEPPISKVGSAAPNDTAAADSGLPESVADALPCFQSSTAPLVTEDRFSLNVRFVPTIRTASTPLSSARSNAPVRPV